MWSVLVLGSATLVVWATLLALLLRAVLRTAWPAMMAGSSAPILVGAVTAGLKYPSWEALLLLIGAPVTAIVVTRGRPARLVDPKWTMPEDEITDEAEALSDRYAWRLVLVMLVAVVFLMITFGW